MSWNITCASGRTLVALLLYLLADATYSTGSEFVIDGGAVTGQVFETLDAQ